jgi:hypothetical protein
MATLSACHKKKLSYSSGVNEEPMYKTDRKVENFREKSGASNATNNYAEGTGTGYSYSSYGSRQEILNEMGKKSAADSLELIATSPSNVPTYTISDTTEVKK